MATNKSLVATSEALEAKSEDLRAQLAAVSTQLLSKSSPPRLSDTGKVKTYNNATDNDNE